MSLPTISHRTPAFHKSYGRMGRAQAFFGLLGILGLAWFNFFNPYDRPNATLMLATAVVMVGMVPAFRWIGDPERDAIPVFQMHAAFYALTYGVAGLMEPGMMFALNWTSDDERQVALLMTLLGLTCLYLGYFLAGLFLKKSKPVIAWPLRLRPTSYPLFILLVLPLLIVASKSMEYFSIKAVGQILTAIYGFSFILLIYAAFSGALKRRMQQVVIFVLIPYQLIFGSNLASSLTFRFIMWSIVIGLTYLTVRRRVPYMWIVLALGFFLLLQPVKREFRDLTWNKGVGGSSSIDKLLLFVSLAESHYSDMGIAAVDHAEEIRKTTSDRMNNLNTLAAVIADTPRSQPYLYGDSYAPLFTKFVPRFLWPNKPREDLGNTWANRYGYLGADDVSTSFNLPWLPEMYMNFGVYGIAILNFFVGVFLALLANAFWKKVSDPSGFAFGMVLGMPLFFVDSNLSMLVGELVIVVIALYVIGRVAAGVMPRFFAWEKS